MLPEWLDYALYENTAAVMLRGLQSNLSENWGKLIASAQAIQGIFQDYDQTDLEPLYQESDILPLIAASRIFDAASQFDDDNISSESAKSLGLAAAAAYGMYGNFPSAAAVIRRSYPDLLFDSEAQEVIAVTSAPSIALELLSKSRRRHERTNFFLENLIAFFYNGDLKSFETIQKQFISILLSASTSLESSLLRSCRICLKHIYNLSITRVLEPYDRVLPRGYVTNLNDIGIHTFLPTQYKAIVRNKFLDNNGNGIVSIPTSTGKTFLGELALAVSLGADVGIACYLVPYIALGRQVVTSLRKHLPPEIRIHSLLGGYAESEPLDPETHQEIIVATPERFDSLLRASPYFIKFLRLIVCDEAHLLQSDTRGVRLEGVLTRIRLLQAQGLNTRLLLLSAVLSHYESLKTWLAIDDTAIITDTWRPTAKRLAIWRKDGFLTWYQALDPIRRSGTREQTAIGRLNIPWPIPVYNTEHFGVLKKQKLSVLKNVAYLAKVLANKYEGAILCICSTKQDTRNLASFVASNFETIQPLPNSISAIIARIQTHHSFLLPLCNILERGVSFHNSSVPPEIRHLIEDAVKRNQLKVIVSTSTLAEGVDLPFRFTIIADWLTWQSGEMRPISPLLFKNIAGRCGRAGVFTEGDTIIFDNPLGIDTTSKSVLQNDLFFSPSGSEISSAVEDIFLRGNKSNAAVLASQFVAAIPENPNTENLVDEFTQHSYIHHIGGYDDGMGKYLNSVVDNITDDSKEAFAVFHSPLQLTELGKSANNTGFSPDSCRAILKFMNKPIENHSLETISQCLIEECGMFPEQTNNDLRRILSRPSHKLCIKKDDFKAIISQWVSGLPLEDIFVQLPYVRRSKREANIVEWLHGREPNSSWDNDYDKFVDVISYILNTYLPWLMHACHWLRGFSGGWVNEVEWHQYSAMVERGVSNQWALIMLHEETTISRRALVEVGRLWPDSADDENDPIGLHFIRDFATRPRIEAVFAKLLEKYQESTGPEFYELTRLKGILWDKAGVYLAP